MAQSFFRIIIVLVKENKLNLNLLCDVINEKPPSRAGCFTWVANESSLDVHAGQKKDSEKCKDNKESKKASGKFHFVHELNRFGSLGFVLQDQICFKIQNTCYIRKSKAHDPSSSPVCGVKCLGS